MVVASLPISIRVAHLNASCQAFRHCRRYSSVLSGSHEQVKVPVHTNGFVTLDIHHPLTSRRSHRTPSLLFHLPPGPSLLRSSPSESEGDPRSVAATLAASSSLPVVSINYRLDRHHLFPTPIHDVLVGYDWAVRNILQPGFNPGMNHASSFAYDQTEHFGRVAVCGELVGGSLALMLALTECRVWDNARVVGAYVEEPIVDWIFEADELMQKEDASNDVFAENIEDENEQDTFSIWHGYYSRSTKQLFKKSRAATMPTKSPLSLRSLMRLRSATFPRDQPHRYYDPFASPIHFLRSPSMPVPQAHSLEEDFAALMGLEDLEYDVPDSIHATSASSSNSSPNEASKRSQPKPRPLRFPPSGTNLRIPHVRIGANDNSPLRGQNAEFIKLLRRSIVKYDSETLKGVGDEFLEDSVDDETREENETRQRDQLEALNRARKDADERASLSTEASEAISTTMERDRIGRMGEWSREVLARMS